MEDIKVKKSGKKLMVKLKDGSKIEFRCVKKYKDGTWRYDSRDIAFESRWNDEGGTKGGYFESDLCRRTEHFINLLPDALADAITPTLRINIDKGGKKNQKEVKIFVPDASEIFPNTEDNDFFVRPYKQLKYYKDTRNRIRLNEDGDPIWYWTASIFKHDPTYAVIGYYHGFSIHASALQSNYVPICFHINPVKLLKDIEFFA